MVEPSAGKNVAVRVRAREIDQKLLDFKRSGQVRGRVTDSDLVERFLADPHARSDAGELGYRSALKVHYLPSVEHPPQWQTILSTDEFTT